MPGGGLHTPTEFVVFSGITDADGNVGGTTLKCAEIGSASSYPNFDGNQIIITSGSYKGQARDINGATNADAAGTITVANAFDGKILEDTLFIIMGIRTVAAEVDAIKVETDKLPGGEYTGTVSAGTAAKTLIKEITTTSRIKIESIWLDLTLLVTAGATIELEHKIDGTNYKVFETDTWALIDDDGVLITGFTINNDFKISITGGEAAGVNIPYNIIYKIMES